MLTVILTGGASRRMGCDKALLETGGSVMSLMLAERFAALGETVFSVDRPGRFSCGAFRELTDVFPGKGPLNGLYSAFSKTAEDIVFLTATDMPCGEPELVRVMLAAMGKNDICTVCRSGGRYEPLFSLYHRRCFPSVERCLREGKLSFYELFRTHPVRMLSGEELPGWDLERILTNVNTPEDYRDYRALP